MESVPAPEWAARARAARYAVHNRFGHRPGGVPGTWLGRATTGSNRFTAWNYWWQAHYLDCEIDAQYRHRDFAEPVDFRRIRALSRGIRLHNFGTICNSFYDDMAWLALAAQRLARLAELSGAGWAGPGYTGGGSLGTGWTQTVLAGQLRSALTDDLSGGLFWSRKRSYKNTAVNGPAALFFARRGDTGTAQVILNWLKSTLWDETATVFRDGVNLPRAAETGSVGRRHGSTATPDGLTDSRPQAAMDPTVWTYNQGPALAAMLCIGTAPMVGWASRLITGVERELSAQGLLQLHGPGDGGLFTGILLRYLALAAQDDRLPDSARGTAATLVFTTADQLWESRLANRSGMLFTPNTKQSADEYFRDGRPVELSGQLQAWMGYEAAYRLRRNLDA